MAQNLTKAREIHCQASDTRPLVVLKMHCGAFLPHTANPNRLRSAAPEDVAALSQRHVLLVSLLIV